MDPEATGAHVLDEPLDACTPIYDQLVEDLAKSELADDPLVSELKQ